MRNNLLYILLIVIISLALSACQSENETPAPQTPEVEKSAADSTPQAVDLEITQQSLENLYIDQESQITAQAPERITTETKKQQKTEISAGVILDEERESLLEAVDGAEVKISVPLY
ncbi:MAG: DUF2931 family protein [Deltaproteobacteria bacterium]|jgi:biopolymer transport protein ExbD|nr:DUF2931 family protein [Deltaproteobacteria bacterium]